MIYNYGRPQVSNYLIANALYWAEIFHADGIRMDAVASMLYLDYGKDDGEWVANMYGGNENLEAEEMLKHLNSMMKKRNPGVLTIAEESTAWPMVTGRLNDGGLGFDLKWNMGFMNDYLKYIVNDPYFRSYHHGELTFSMIYAYSENFMLVFSHDEVVHGKSSMLGKMPGEREDKFANLRTTYAYMMTHPGKKLLFMGQDIGEFDEWNEERCVEWELLSYENHKGLHRLVTDLNHLYTALPALSELDDSPEGFAWINSISADESYLSYMRKGSREEDTLVVLANFAGVEHKKTIGVPLHGQFKEILNTDAEIYGGQGRINSRVKRTKEAECDGYTYSLDVRMAPLSVSIWSYQPYTEEELAKMKAKAEEKAAQKIKKEKKPVKADKPIKEKSKTIKAEKPVKAEKSAKEIETKKRTAKK